MALKAILAVDQHGAMGLQGRLPWDKNSNDLNWFYNHIQNRDVIVGRKTWDTIPTKVVTTVARKFILTSRRPEPDNTMKRYLTVDQLEQFGPEGDAWVIGGKSVYEQLIPECQEVYLTIIPGIHRADTFIDWEALVRKAGFYCCMPDRDIEMKDGTRFLVWRNK